MTDNRPLAQLPDGGRFVALDSLRGLAALLVAAYHIKGGGPLFENAVARHGYLFVDFFFVLSGFVIAGAYGRRIAEGFSLLRYMFLRLGRLYPLHLFMLAVYLALEVALVFVLPRDLVLREPFTGERSPASLLLSLTFTHALVHPYTGVWNALSWSIAIEFWLYLAIAVVWRFAGRLGWIVALGAALACIGLFAADFTGWHTPFSRQMAQGTAAFGLGVAVWELWDRGLRNSFTRLTSAIGTALEAGVAVAIVAALSSPALTGTTMMNPLFALAVLIFAAERGLLSRLLRTWGFVWLGVLSYSIYMVHGLVVGRGIDLASVAGYGVTAEVDGMVMRMIDAPPLLADLIGIALLAASVCAAYVTWRLVEWPSREWSRRKAARWGAEAAERRAPTI